MPERISSAHWPTPERDPGSRQRLDREQMRERDDKIAKMLKQHVPYRTIAARLNMSLGSVCKAVNRINHPRPRGSSERPSTAAGSAFSN